MAGSVTRALFVEVAAMIARERAAQSHHRDAGPACSAIDSVCDGLASVFANYNPAFDRDRFIAACQAPPPGAKAK